MNVLKGILPLVADAVMQAGPGELARSETRAGEPTLSGPEGMHYHSNYCAGQEAQRWFCQLNLDGVQTLFVYGVGMGHYYRAVKDWLAADPDRYVVFLEDDLHVLYHLMQVDLGTHILHDKQVQLHFIDWSNPQPMIEWLGWYFVQQQVEFTSLDAYQRYRTEQAAQLQRALMHEMVGRAQMVAEYLRGGSSFFHNVYSNTHQLHRSFHGNKLFGRFRGVPAIICGAGPSLNQHFELLGQLKDRALIFGGGSSLNALSDHGILPHFGAGIDPNPTQLQRLSSNTAFSVPFFYRSRMHYQAFSTICGPRLYVNGTGGYPIGEYLEKRLGIEGEMIDEGHNVVNFCAEIARALGCDPILFVGMDLAYTGMQSYASGVVDDPTVSQQAVSGIHDLEAGAFVRKDIYGKDVYTLWKWVAEAKWIGEFAGQVSDRTVLNCTEGGLGFPSVPNVPLKEAVDQFCVQTQDLGSRVTAEILSAKMPEVTAEGVQHVIDELRESLKRCIELSEQMIDALEEIVAGRSQSLKKAEGLEAKLLDEQAYGAVLAVFNEVFGKTQQREVNQIRHDPTIKSPQERRQRQVQASIRKFQFLIHTAQTNLTVMERAIGNQEKAHDH